MRLFKGSSWQNRIILCVTQQNIVGKINTNTWFFANEMYQSVYWKITIKSVYQIIKLTKLTMGADRNSFNNECHWMPRISDISQQIARRGEEKRPNIQTWSETINTNRSHSFERLACTFRNMRAHRNANTWATKHLTLFWFLISQNNK
jgi:hypothetical protein